MASLEGCEVRQITRQQARRIILQYEWLASAEKAESSLGLQMACYGLITANDEIAGVVTFSPGPGHSRHRWLDGAHVDKIICLERGACVHWAHPHAASFLIRRAARLAADHHGWELFYAYSDPAAGEIGTVYQAANWWYIGCGVGHGCDGVRYGVRPPHVEKGDYVNYLSTRRLWQPGTVRNQIAAYAQRAYGIEYTGKGAFKLARELGYIIEKDRPEKHVYLLPIVRRRWWGKQLAAKGWTPKPYPKRAETT